MFQVPSEGSVDKVVHPPTVPPLYSGKDTLKKGHVLLQPGSQRHRLRSIQPLAMR
jgi:hypothetical protein